MKDKPLTPQQAAEYLGLSVATLNTWRCTKRYNLPYVKIGGSVRYMEADLQRFVERRTVRIKGGE
jgi:excisionase family DNA binding protein